MFSLQKLSAFIFGINSTYTSENKELHFTIVNNITKRTFSVHALLRQKFSTVEEMNIWETKNLKVKSDISQILDLVEK